MKNSPRVQAWLLTDQSTGLSRCLTGPGQSLLSNPGALMLREKRRPTLCGLHYSQGQSGKKSEVRKCERKKGRQREKNKETEAQKGERKGVTLRTKCKNQDPREHH